MIQWFLNCLHLSLFLCRFFHGMCDLPCLTIKIKKTLFLKRFNRVRVYLLGQPIGKAYLQAYWQAYLQAYWQAYWQGYWQGYGINLWDQSMGSIYGINLWDQSMGSDQPGMFVSLKCNLLFFIFKK